MVRFSPAWVVQSEGIPGVDSSTLWTQSVELVIEACEMEGATPELPARLTGGSVEAGGYRHIDMLPVPLESEGYLALSLIFSSGETVALRGAGGRLALEGHPKYVRHLEP